MLEWDTAGEPPGAAGICSDIDAAKVKFEYPCNSTVLIVGSIMWVSASSVSKHYSQHRQQQEKKIPNKRNIYLREMETTKQLC